MKVDRRLTPSNGRVAALSLAGKVQAERFVKGTPARITVPVADLCPTPGGARDRQLIWGEAVTVYEQHAGHAFVQADKDGYVGYLRAAEIGEAGQATHVVCTPATHLYEGESLKSADLAHLSFGSRVTVAAERDEWWETPDGYIPKTHLRPVGQVFTDPLAVARLFLGVPYLWGGNSIRGIDCSGLVQASLVACGIECPGDSDLQRAALGRDLAPDAPRKRGDLYWWAGHVGILADPDTLLHANAHYMATVCEPIDVAIVRIKAQGDGDVLRRARL